MLNRLGSLRFLLAVIETGSVRQAATACNISQPALSRQIQSLEEELGVPLFDRSSRGMLLTPYGQIVSHYAREIEFSCDNLLREIGDIIDGEKGTLRISAGPGWSYSLVPDAISRLHQIAPGISVECTADPVTRSLVDLLAGHVDVVINRLDSTPVEMQGLVHQKLLTIEHFIFARRDHPLAGKCEVSVEALQPYPWISFRNSVEARRAISELFSSTGLPSPEPTVVTNSYQTSLNLIGTGDYLMVLPSTLANTAKRQEMEILQLNFVLGSFPAGLIFRPATLRLSYFRRFKTILEAVVEEQFCAESN